MLRPQPELTRITLSQRTRRLLWSLAVADMAALAWMVAIGSWLDNASRLTQVITLGGHHLLVLIMALVGFLMLAGAALLTAGFTDVGALGLMLMLGACMVSVSALAGALSLILMSMAAAVLLGLLVRLFIR